MPQISRFYGIVVFMNYREHPPAHLHARYGEQEVTIALDSGAVTGTMNRRSLRLLFQWMDIHEELLWENWRLARSEEPLKQIPPLP